MVLFVTGAGGGGNWRQAGGAGEAAKQAWTAPAQYNAYSYS